MKQSEEILWSKGEKFRILRLAPRLPRHTDHTRFLLSKPTSLPNAAPKEDIDCPIQAPSLPALSSKRLSTCTEP